MGVSQSAGMGRAPERTVASTIWGDIVPWALAIVLAAVGTITCYEGQPGVNWGIWTTLAGAALLWIAARRAAWLRPTEPAASRGVEPVAAWTVGLAVAVSWGAAVTANPLFYFFILISCVVLLATAMRVVGGVHGDDVGALGMATAPLAGLGAATVEAGRRAVRAAGSARDERRAAATRGLLVAIPVAGLFALVLAGADPVLATWRDQLWTALTRIDVLQRCVLSLGLATLTLGAFGIAARAPTEGSTARLPAPRGRMGSMERRIIVGAVGAVFGAFLLFQSTYLFRDVHALRVSGMTYAEYAHRGFVELTLAATLAVALILALDRYTTPPAAGSATRTWRDKWGMLLFLAEVLIVLASAFHRLTLYESAYGYTMLRLYVQSYVIGVAAAMVLLACEVSARAFDGRRFARRAAATAVGFLIVLSFANPEAWVVSGNMARFRASGKLDIEYLASLSLNAVPSVTAAMSELPAPCAEEMRWSLARKHAWEARGGDELPWYMWNLRRERGIAALRAVHASEVGRSGTILGCPTSSNNDPYYEFGPS